MFLKDGLFERLLLNYVAVLFTKIILTGNEKLFHPVFYAVDRNIQREVHMSPHYLVT